MWRKGLQKIIRCPSCKGVLEQADTTLACQDCGASYLGSERQLDLRLPHPQAASIPVILGRPRPYIPLQPIPINPILGRERSMPFPGLGCGNGLTPTLYSWFPQLGPDKVMLDLGCGDRRFEPACQVTGAGYIGLDVDGDMPDVLGQGEALPFADESFDFVLAIAVLPHAQHPTLVAQEISRVLRPGSLFIGSAQFLEPCMIACRHHVTALGLIDWLDDAGLEILHLEPNREWDGLMALARMGINHRALCGEPASGNRPHLRWVQSAGTTLPRNSALVRALHEHNAALKLLRRERPYLSGSPRPVGR